MGDMGGMFSAYTIPMVKGKRRDVVAALEIFTALEKNVTAAREKI